ncbi:MAG: hypothetical protein ACXW6V_24165, partial [Candidatus Binatia bacterium]
GLILVLFAVDMRLLSRFNMRLHRDGLITGFPAHRYPKDEVDPKSRRLDGVKYRDTDQWLAMKPVLKVVDDALAAAGKK